MDASINSLVRRPEYTGVNRCYPCTIVNTVIAAVLSGGVAIGLLERGLDVAVSLGGGGVFLTIALAAIWARGYLVPYTPQLTKRYLPARLLAWFDKSPADGVASHRIGQLSEEFAPETFLLGTQTLEECADADDLCLSSEFRSVWTDRVRRVRRGTIELGDIARAFGLSSDAIQHVHSGRLGGKRITAGTLQSSDFDGTITVYCEGGEWIEWESWAALIADLGTAAGLSETTREWHQLNPAERASTLRSLRIFLPSCPTCDGPIAFDEEPADSCCQSYTLFAVSCGDCGSKLFEERLDTAVAE